MVTSPAEQVTVCTMQPAVYWQQAEHTFRQIEQLLEQATDQASIDVAVLPEHFNAAIDEDGQFDEWQAAYQFAAGLARRHRMNLVAGSVERWDEAAQARFNTAVLFDRRGEELGRYDKRQLFGYEKQRSVRPGQESLAVELDGVRCGVLICADLWYPELVRRFAGTADLLCVPAQTTMRPESQPAYARMLWHNLAMTRAQENVLAVAVSDQAADSAAPYVCGGVASITDPSAEPNLELIQRTVDGGRAGFVCATIDLAKLARFRAYRRKNGLLPEPAQPGELAPALVAQH